MPQIDHEAEKYDNHWAGGQAGTALVLPAIALATAIFAKHCGTNASALLFAPAALLLIFWPGAIVGVAITFAIGWQQLTNPATRTRFVVACLIATPIVFGLAYFLTASKFGPGSCFAWSLT